MVDLVLRRRILEARKAGKSRIADPTQDPSLIDMLFVMLVAVCLLLLFLFPISFWGGGGAIV